MEDMIEEMKKIYNVKDDELKPLPKLIVLQPGETVEGRVKGLRKIITRYGERTVIDLETEKEDIAILVTHKSLAREFIRLWVENNGLKGKKVSITNNGKQGRYYNYTVEVEIKDRKRGKK